MRVLRVAIGVAVVLGLCAALASAQEGTGEMQMSAEQQAMMEAFAKAGTPGKEHEWLSGKAGKWNFAGKFWMDPAAPPTESTGTVERTAMLGGRVLAERVVSEFMGEPFEGHGMTGFDNVTGRFWSTWNDNHSTAVMISYGECDGAGNCTYEGEYADAVSGAMRKTRFVSHHEGSDREHHEAFETGPDGSEMKTMELVYTRAE